MMHERTPTATWIVGPRARLTPALFNSLRIINGSDPASIPPGEPCRALIDGRWHYVERRYSFGLPRFHADPIVIVLECA